MTNDVQVNLSFGAFGSSGGGDADRSNNVGGGAEDCGTCVLKAIWVPGSQVCTQSTVFPRRFLCAWGLSYTAENSISTLEQICLVVGSATSAFDQSVCSHEENPDLPCTCSLTAKLPQIGAFVSVTKLILH